MEHKQITEPTEMYLDGGEAPAEKRGRGYALNLVSTITPAIGMIVLSNSVFGSGRGQTVIGLGASGAELPDIALSLAGGDRGWR